MAVQYLMPIKMSLILCHSWLCSSDRIPTDTEISTGSGIKEAEPQGWVLQIGLGFSGIVALV